MVKTRDRCFDVDLKLHSGKLYADCLEVKGIPIENFKPNLLEMNFPATQLLDLILRNVVIEMITRQFSSG